MYSSASALLYLFDFAAVRPQHSAGIGHTPHTHTHQNMKNKNNNIKNMNNLITNETQLNYKYVKDVHSLHSTKENICKTIKYDSLVELKCKKGLSLSFALSQSKWEIVVYYYRRTGLNSLIVVLLIVVLDFYFR